MDRSADPSEDPRILLAGTADWLDEFAETAETRIDAQTQVVSTVSEIRAACGDRSIDCLLTTNRLSNATGMELLRAIRADDSTLPVVFAPADGSEALASEAVAAGISEYVPISDPHEDAFQELLDRVEASVHSARSARKIRDRAEQFDAIFEDERTATWVLDPDGTLLRANRTARELAASDETDVSPGRPFRSLPPWSHDEQLRSDVRRIVERARDGSFATAVLTGVPGGDDTHVVELSARPVETDHGTTASILIEGVDVTERVELERDLRRSERLHRVTLNNMTDTVLITDEAGEYTYVCPNVHFIFGYTAAEIRELGTIDELLGEDLFDREELAETGMLKNIECTATDRAGREHTLLVNVREVSIQGGTLLYSCRDVTKRKQREEALATLQGTAREFLYAESHPEIATHVVDDVPAVLDLDASAVYLFGRDDNRLRPVAVSPGMERVTGTLPEIPVDADGPVTHSFLEDESLFFEDVHAADIATDPTTELGSAAYIPLGDHGVFVVGSTDVNSFDDARRELADLLAATAEAALDRVSRESQLREQDRSLQRRNEDLRAVNRINETIRSIDRALVQAETREEIDHTVCELLTAEDRFRFAWIGDVDPATETVVPRAWAGHERGYLDDRRIDVRVDDTEPAGRTAATREVTTVANVAERLREEEWRTGALACDFLSVVSVPLVYNDVSYGVLTVYADARNAFDETSREVLAELAETIASATSAIERRNALVTSSVVRLEFELTDSTFVLSRLAEESSCTIAYHGGVQQTAEGSDVFITVEDVPVDRVETAAMDLLAVESVDRITVDGVGGVLRLRLSRPFPALELADHGAVLHAVSATPESTTISIEIAGNADVRHVSDLVADLFGESTLRSKRTIDRSPGHLRSRVFDRLTDRQLEVVRTAYYSGFFESPRENTGEDVAEMLDISATAFYRHVRAADRTLFGVLFDEIDPTLVSRS
ncbi:bacterio-opsin activator domain-containing protein [Halopenitus sp. H-Gu1]|uniref:bacterio-opsin activator domain-containing protein n=1 Tax=Halopenitus sp. H-Gu1 TaxID=3242697 RepID=UPI00359D67A8